MIVPFFPKYLIFFGTISILLSVYFYWQIITTNTLAEKLTLYRYFMLYGVLLFIAALILFEVGQRLGIINTEGKGG